MRLVLLLAFITVLSLVYVHQQVEAVKLSYAIESKEKKLKDMLDHNESLGYNIDNLESPSRLEKILLAHNIEIVYPKRKNVVRMARLTPKAEAERRVRLGVEKGANILSAFDFFVGRAEAHAKEK
ncbi:MAG: hypothetical protein WC592_02000 [Candidatus Omnitrophota bacterium]